MKIRPLTTVNLACLSLRERQYRSACLIALIAAVTFVVTGGSLFGFSLLNGVSNTESRLGADLMIVPAGAERGYEGALLSGKPGTFYLERETVEELFHADGIEQASPQLYIATFDSSHCAFPVQVIGFDPKTDFVIAPWLENETPGGPGYGEIVAGFNVRAEVGDSLLLFGDEYRTAGRLGKTGTGFDNSVFLNMDTAQKIVADYKKYDEAAVLPDQGGVVSVVVADVTRGLDPDEFAKNLRKEFRGKGITVIRPQAIISGLTKNLTLTIGIMSILLTALWLLASLVLAIVFALTVNERKKELGVYRSLGATRRKLAGIILAESVILGVTGAALGIGMLCLIVFPFNALIESRLQSEYLLPDAAATGTILAAGFLACAAMGPVAAAFSAVRIGLRETYLVIREGE
jgi:putative ABC transport system permease protein